MKIKYIVWGLITSMVMVQAVNVGDVLPPLTIEKKNGSNSNGKAWYSQSLQGRVHVLLYMDPDERKEAMPFLDTLNSKNFDEKKYSTVAVINLAAMWMPNFVLETMLKDKQKELRNTTFIFDKTKYLVQKWQLKDDASNVLIVDAKGKLLYQKSGKLFSVDVEKIMDIVSTNIDKIE